MNDKLLLSEILKYDDKIKQTLEGLAYDLVYDKDKTSNDKMFTMINTTGIPKGLQHFYIRYYKMKVREYQQRDEMA